MSGRAYENRIILPVLMSGDLAADERETRIGIRYAVIAALTNQYYAERTPTTLEYVVLPNRELGNCVVDQIVPFDIFENWLHSNDPDYPPVLIFYINQEYLTGRPVTALGKILAELRQTDDLDQLRSECISHITYEDAAMSAGRSLLALESV